MDSSKGHRTMKSKFQRGQSTYTCQSCKKLTRNTDCEGQVRLCADCFELAGCENHLTDNGAESLVEQYGSVVKSIFADRPELRNFFPTLSKEIPMTATATKTNAKKSTTAESNGKAQKNGKSEMVKNGVTILKLLKQREYTLKQLETKTGLSSRAVYHAIYHLREDGYVKEQQHEDSRALFFATTAKGTAAIAK